MKKVNVNGCRLIWGSAFGLILCLAASTTFAQTKYEISVSDIAYLKVHQNWMFLPSAVDLRVEWTVSAREEINQRARRVYKDARDLPFTFRVFIFAGGTDSQPEVREVRGTDHFDIPGLPIGSQYAFRVAAYSENGTLVAESQTASILVGKGDIRNQELLDKTWVYYLNPGRWQLATLGKAEVYDKSTPLGKLAFIFLSVTGFVSFFVLVFYSSRTLYLGNIFPYKRSTKSMLWSFMLSCDKSYEKRLTNKFKFILKAWETIATRSRRVADEAVKNIPHALSSTEKMASVEVACMEYWTMDGDKAIGAIEDIISFPEYNGGNGNKNPDDLLTELVIKIEDSFHDLVSSNGNGHYSNGDHEDMATLIEEIYEPVVVDEKPLSRVRKWLLKKGVFDLRKGLKPFPTSRIIHAGLGIHRMNGYRWLRPTEEVKRAFEDRASNEIESLKRKSRIEWFWNYGALAPLVGLFGTVTGITFAFQQLSETGVTPDFVNTIQHLSSGIFEALWTTIFGLANGIFFLMVYYYFKHKLDWIYSKWEEIYVSITEKL